jgi:hypothetical protein
VQRYWDALDRADGEAMAACYAHDATFRDEVFELVGDDIGAMWRMLLRPGADVVVTTHALQETPTGASGAWEAVYRFPSTGRRVHNRIESSFTVAGDAIVAQRDRFPFWKWSRMALGPVGWLLGWTPMLRRQVQARARSQLARAEARRA